MLDDQKVLESINKFKKGDIRGFEEIVTKYQDRVYHLAYRLVHNHEDALDISQEVFIQAFKVIKKWKPKASLFTWLYRVTLNISRDYKRHLSCSKHNKKLFAETNVTSGIAKDPAKKLLNKELKQKIIEALESLPARQKEVLILRKYEDLSIKETSRILKCPVGTVKSNLYKAIKNMELRLKDYLDGELP